MPQTSPPVPAPPPSQRALARVKRHERRDLKAEAQERLFDLVVSGLSYDEVARRLHISVASVRRHVDRALTRREMDAPQRYVGLQMERLSRALCVASLAVQEGEVRAIPTLIKVMGELDRYHGLAARLAPQDEERAPPVALPSPSPGSEAPVGALPPATSNVAASDT